MSDFLILNDGGFPGSTADKESACNMGDLGLIPGLGRSPQEGNGYPLQYALPLPLSCYLNSHLEPGPLPSLSHSMRGILAFSETLREWNRNGVRF